MRHFSRKKVSVISQRRFEKLKFCLNLPPVIYYAKFNVIYDGNIRLGTVLILRVLCHGKTLVFEPLYWPLDSKGLSISVTPCKLIYPQLVFQNFFSQSGEQSHQNLPGVTRQLMRALPRGKRGWQHSKIGVDVAQSFPQLHTKWQVQHPR